MNAYVFNLALAFGWALVSVGGCLIRLGWGLIGSGVLLLALTLFMALRAGVYLPKKAVS